MCVHVQYVYVCGSILWAILYGALVLALGTLTHMYVYMCVGLCGTLVGKNLCACVNRMS